jgi:Raf kinase inhibitor-like YbhB/YbcL family protein
MEITSPAFPDGGEIPREFGAASLNQSPPLAWTEPHSETRSLVIVMIDIDAGERGCVHWLLCGIPGDYGFLPRGVGNRPIPLGIGQAVNGTNDFGSLGYRGPTLEGAVERRYLFRLIALDANLPFTPGMNRDDVETLMESHVVGEAGLIGRYVPERATSA